MLFVRKENEFIEEAQRVPNQKKLGGGTVDSVQRGITAPLAGTIAPIHFVCRLMQNSPPYVRRLVHRRNRYVQMNVLVYGKNHPKPAGLLENSEK